MHLADEKLNDQYFDAVALESWALSLPGKGIHSPWGNAWKENMKTYSSDKKSLTIKMSTKIALIYFILLNIYFIK